MSKRLIVVLVLTFVFCAFAQDQSRRTKEILGGEFANQEFRNFGAEDFAQMISALFGKGIPVGAEFLASDLKDGRTDVFVAWAKFLRPKVQVLRTVPGLLPYLQQYVRTQMMRADSLIGAAELVPEELFSFTFRDTLLFKRPEFEQELLRAYDPAFFTAWQMAWKTFDGIFQIDEPAWDSLFGGLKAQTRKGRFVATGSIRSAEIEGFEADPVIKFKMAKNGRETVVLRAKKEGGEIVDVYVNPGEDDTEVELTRVTKGDTLQVFRTDGRPLVEKVF